MSTKSSPLPRPRVALVYDWATVPYGGAERVLEQLHILYPDAPLYTAVHDPVQAPWSADWQVRTSFLQRFPWAKRHYRWLAPLMPLAFESFNFDQFEVVISVTSFAAKGVLTKPGQLHLCYMLTPPRFLYSHVETYWARSVIKHLGLLLTWPIRAYLTWWDQVAALRPDLIIPISRVVQSRISRLYSLVPEAPLYPPVEPFIDSQSIGTQAKKSTAADNSVVIPPGSALVVSRLVDYKRIDLAIQACHQLSIPLTVIGDGPARASLSKLVTRLGSQTRLLGRQSSETTALAVSQAGVLLMPGLEDFGITAVAAVASGIPVILHQDSGAAEVLPELQKKLHIATESVEAVVKALQTWQGQTWPTKSLKQNMNWYDTTNFRRQFALDVDWWRRRLMTYNGRDR